MDEAQPGLSPTLPVLLADALGDQRPDELHVTWHLPLGRRDVDARMRDAILATLERPARSWWQGHERRSRAAEHRRIAWFPQPVGVTHAIVVGLPEVPLLHRRFDAPTVTGGVTLSSARAEVVQAAARDGAVAEWLRARLVGPGREVSADRRAVQRWAVVVEAVTRDGVARAWANGTDVVGSHDAVVDAVTATGRTGAALLDDLADQGTLRWAVRRP